MNNLIINTQVLNDKIIIELEGPIDEDSKFNEITKLSSSLYIFDFDKVVMINSCGIREWNLFLETLPKEAKTVYRNCPKIIIEQINMVHGFIKEGGIVESFYAPYFCNTCDEEKLLKLSPCADTKNNKAPEHQCDKCGQTLEFDGLEQQYFLFVMKAN